MPQEAGRLSVLITLYPALGLQGAAAFSSVLSWEEASRDFLGCWAMQGFPVPQIALVGL